MPDLVSPNNEEDSAEDNPEGNPEGNRDDAPGDLIEDEDSGVIRIGCSDLPPGLPRQRYFERLSYLEMSSTLHGIPQPAVQKRWRKDTGDHGHLGLLAPQVITHRPGPRGYARATEPLAPAELAQAGGFRATPVVQRAIEELASAATESAAEVVLFRSPPDFAPSASNREAMRVFFRELAPQALFGDTVRVWEPQGLWEIEVAARFASELGVVLACDPLVNDPLAPDPDIYSHLPGDEVYFRVTGMGSRRPRFDDYAMESLMSTVEPYARTWVVFANPGKYPDALRFHRLLAAEEA